MDYMKDLLSAVRKGLENFSSHIIHSTQIYKRKQETLWQPQRKAVDPSMPIDDMVTTMGTSIDSFITIL